MTTIPAIIVALACTAAILGALAVIALRLRARFRRLDQRFEALASMLEVKSVEIQSAVAIATRRLREAAKLTPFSVSAMNRTTLS